MTLTAIKPKTRWTANDQIFLVLAVYNPNEEHDPWVQYINESTKQEYTCRAEAFEARFTPRVD